LLESSTSTLSAPTPLKSGEKHNYTSVNHGAARAIVEQALLESPASTLSTPQPRFNDGLNAPGFNQNNVNMGWIEQHLSKWFAVDKTAQINPVASTVNNSAANHRPQEIHFSPVITMQSSGDEQYDQGLIDKIVATLKGDVMDDFSDKIKLESFGDNHLTDGILT